MLQAGNPKTALAFMFALILATSVAACDASSPVGETANSKAAETPREQLFASATEIQPLFEGMPAPGFTVHRPGGEAFTFEPGKLQRPVIIYFYRGGWCPYCNAQLMELRKVEDELDSMGFDQYFLSADSTETLAKGMADLEEPLDYELLSDNDLLAAKKFGIAFKVDEDTLQRYEQYGIDLIAASGRKHQALPVPAVFIINAEGMITFAYVNPDYRFRLHPDVLLSAAGVAQDDRNVRERVQQ